MKLKKLMSIVLLILCSQAQAENLEGSVKKIPKFDKTLFSLEITDLGVRVYDSYTTRYNLRHKNYYEDRTPQFIAQNNFREFALAGFMTGVNYLAAYELKKHGHRRLALLVPIIDIACDLPAGIKNAQIAK